MPLRSIARLAALVSVTALALGCEKKTETSTVGTVTSASATPATLAASAMATSTTSAGSPSIGSASKLEVGDKAPEVDLPLQDGRHVKLSQFAGKSVVLYFYPKDQTSGCTVESQNFRDKFADLQKAGVTVFGVSTQDAESHKAFIAKEKLPFDLAIDGDLSIAKAFGVPVHGDMHARQTFLIGKDGKVKKIWRDVTPKDHAVDVLSAAQS